MLKITIEPILEDEPTSIMGEELCDTDINLAQRLLRRQFPELGCLQSTLLQQKEASILEKKRRCYKLYIDLVAITG